MTYDEWHEHYKPVKNHIDTNASMDGYMFETFGSELAFVQAANPAKVWTYVDDGEYQAITNGLVFVNRMGYFVTEEAHVSSESEPFIDIDLTDDDEEETA
ncbi:hypothetical protein PXK56_17890 [Phaeobacter gallaeciensis]|uniref:hypothetical protein n=1 Tax=Phaeobacter gallaeciensis TaxID=60890 RepID=UPI00238050D9|nr:hypothetical protein [Phaeobacter gallaeciensis]MDE4297061.1 hypothetical protein [Phaeobacter gallaeciensis]